MIIGLAILSGDQQPRYLAVLVENPPEVQIHVDCSAKRLPSFTFTLRNHTRNRDRFRYARSMRFFCNGVNLNEAMHHCHDIHSSFLQFRINCQKILE